MVITLDNEMEQLVSDAAQKHGQDVLGYVRMALLEQLRTETPSQQRYSNRKSAIEREFQEAANDPLFLQDNEEVSRDFQHSDAETARLMIV